MSEGVSASVREFLLAHVDSIEQLEVLLLLAAAPAIALTAQQVSDQLRTARSSADNRLRTLSDHQLVETTDGQSYRLRADEGLTAVLREVAAAYRDYRVSVVTLIYSRPSNVVRVFADAFVFKKGRKDG